jgi:small subunit ribosomal protein S18
MKTPSTRPSNENLLVHDVVFLRKFMTEQGKILSRRSTGISAKEQRKISKAIKHARLLGLLQFVHTR